MKKIRKKKSAEAQAEENVNVISRKSKKGYTLEKEGKYPDQSDKHFESNSVGMSVGSTINTGDYENLRVDVWATVDIEEGEEVRDALDRVSRILDEKLRDTVNYYVNDEDDD